MYFYHHYTEEQPDLNLRNENVQEEVKVSEQKFNYNNKHLVENEDFEIMCSRPTLLVLIFIIKFKFSENHQVLARQRCNGFCLGFSPILHGRQ